MKQTKIHVPAMAAAKAKTARPHRDDDGINSSASKIPNCADEIVAPVVGETNLFMQSCCMIRPEILIPTPVQRIARRRGSRDLNRISICSKSPRSTPSGLSSITPRNSDTTDSTASNTARRMVRVFGFILGSSSQAMYRL